MPGSLVILDSTLCLGRKRGVDGGVIEAQDLKAAPETRKASVIQDGSGQYSIRR